MTLCDSYIVSNLQDWMANVRQRVKDEQQVMDDDSEIRAPYAAVPRDTMQALFSISHEFVIEAEVKYLAVHLFNRYLNRIFSERLKSEPEVTRERTEQVRQEISSQHKLEMVSCLQIASKVDLLSDAIKIGQVQLMLDSIDPGRHYPRQDVVASELRVLCKLDYRLPAVLPLTVLELLLAHGPLPRSDHLRETCLKLLDTAYVRHDHLFGQLHLTQRGFEYDKTRPECKDFLRIELDAGLVAAAVLLCCAFVFRVNKGHAVSVAARLAQLLDVDRVYLGTMAQLLFVSVVDDEGDMEAAPSDDDEDDADDDDAGTREFFSQFANCCLSP